MHLADIGQTDRRIVWFGWSGKDRAEADVIGAFALSSTRLLKTVGRFADQNRPTDLCARDCDRIILLADVHAFHWDFARHLGVIVHDQRNRSRRCNLVKSARKIDKLIERRFFAAQLDEIDISLDQSFGDAGNVGGDDVAQVKDTVELAITERAQCRY